MQESYSLPQTFIVYMMYNLFGMLFWFFKFNHTTLNLKFCDPVHFDEKEYTL